MNGYPASEFSSGCESGWTMYLDNSSTSHPNYSCQKEDQQVDHLVEEEDLSMVSDASSGPQAPHFNEHEDYCNSQSDEFHQSLAYSSVPNTLMKKSLKRQKTDQQQQKQSSLLDDTAASSHVLSFSKNNLKITTKQAPNGNALEVSRQALETHEKYQRGSALQKAYGLFKSAPRNSTPAAEPVVCRRKDRANRW